MALRPNTTSFTPGTGLQSSSSSSTSSSSNNSNSNSNSKVFSSSSSSSTASLSVPVTSGHSNRGLNNTGNSRTLPRISQGKRGQTQRKSERRNRATDQDLSADPLMSTVTPPP